MPGGAIRVGTTLTDRLSKSVAGAANVSLSASETEAFNQEYTGALTGNIQVIIPATHLLTGACWLVENKTTGNFTLTFIGATGTGIVVPQGAKWLLMFDGTNIVRKLAVVTTTPIQIENLGAGGDITDRAEFCAPENGCTLLKAGIVPQGASAGIDNSNTAVIDLKQGANTIVSKTYDTANQPPAANAYGSLGNLDATYRVLAANVPVLLVVTQGATADLPAFLLILEWAPN